MTDILSTSELDLLKIEFLPIISNQYEKGICHLNADLPHFHDAFKKIREDVENYNLSLEIFYEKLDFIIRTEFEGIIELNTTYSYEQDFYILGINPVKEVILVSFLRHLNKIYEYDKKTICHVCKSAILSDIANRATCSYVGKKPFQIFGYLMTNLHFELPFNLNNPNNAAEGIPQTYFEAEKSNNIKTQLIIDHICAITSDEEIFKTFNQINSMRDRIMKSEREISDQIKQISKSINKGDYERIAECCTDKKIL